MGCYMTVAKAIQTLRNSSEASGFQENESLISELLVEEDLILLVIRGDEISSQDKVAVINFVLI